jgi:hypothetical protein
VLRLATQVEKNKVVALVSEEEAVAFRVQLQPIDFRVVWDGGESRTAVEIHHLDRLRVRQVRHAADVYESVLQTGKE